MEKEKLIKILTKSKYAIDCIYSKERIKTPFLKVADECNIPHKDGLDMLVYQGVLACEYFMNDYDSREIITKAMKESLK